MVVISSDEEELPHITVKSEPKAQPKAESTTPPAGGGAGGGGVSTNPPAGGGVNGGTKPTDPQVPTSALCLFSKTTLVSQSIGGGGSSSKIML